jgi:anaerobic ribonucleoside-triphosphate reductase activating protein
MQEFISVTGTSTSTIDGIGISYNIFFQGCSHNCTGCQNPELKPFGNKTIVSIDDIIIHIDNNISFYDSVVLTGGDPVDQPYALLHLLDNIELPTILYTGYHFSEIPSEIISLCTIIIDGPYIQELSQVGFPNTSNQKVYINKSKCSDSDEYRFLINHDQVMSNYYWS